MGEEFVKADATNEDIAEIRRQVLEYVKENGSALFDSRDLDKFRSDNIYVNRFFKHVTEISGDQIKNASNMIINTFKWRKETGIADLNESNLSPSLMEKGVLYAKSRDIDGKRLIVFDVKKHFKGKEKMDDMKTYLLYFIERIDREENGDKLTLVFDCSGSGIRNMDMEFIQYMLGIFKEYVPDVLNYILVFEMPWVLNAAWKIIKSWLPAAAVRKIKFLNKGNMSDYVMSDQLFLAWGGDYEWDYVFEKEVENQQQQQNSFPPAYETLTNNFSEPIMVEEEARKKVSFAATNSLKMNFENNSSSASSTPAMSPNNNDNRSIDSMASLVSKSTLNTGNFENAKNMLQLEPHDEIVFSQRDGVPAGDLLGTVSVKNIAEFPVAFKIKTTSPEKYRVRPSMSLLKAGASMTVEIFFQLQTSVSTLVKDKFLITAIYVEQDTLNHSQLAEAVKSKKADAQYRLRCSLSANAETFQKGSLIQENSVMPQKMSKLSQNGPAPNPTTDKSNKQIETLSKKISALSQTSEEIKNDLAFFKMLLYGLIVLILFLIIILFWRTPVLSAETCTNLLLHTAQANYLNDGILVNPEKEFLK